MINTNYGMWVKTLIDEIKNNGWEGISSNQMESIKNNFSILILEGQFADDGSGYRLVSVSATSTDYNLNNYKSSVRFFDVDEPSGVFPPYYQATSFRINAAFSKRIMQKLNKTSNFKKSKMLLDKLRLEFDMDD